MRCGRASVALLLWLGMPSMTAEAAVRYCLPMLIGAEQTAGTETEAKRLALASWTGLASKLGPQYAGWQTANTKTLSCRRSAAAGGGGKGGKEADVGFICQARASPCTISQVPLPPGRSPPPTRPPGGKAIEA